MSDQWQTKYGSRRVRRDPPTLDEAVFAAVGITDDVAGQAEIAAALMGVPVEDAQAQVKKSTRLALRQSSVVAGDQGSRRTIVVERRGRRAVGAPRRL